ncbi:unnamed protein product [Polarella glacialis]|uniref:Uncharacterized protein n=1 Tax=Polarella glacialis TaxID=89957 RepID=A0A813HEU0_POLGL|nr:unnamed protein product [Polarella glacialis]
MDPALAAHFARQQEKEKLEKEDDVVPEIGSQAHNSKQLDPVLAKFWAKQQEREEKGESDIGEIGSAADKSVKLDPVLAKRWSQQQEREKKDWSEIGEIGSAADKSLKIDPELAKLREKLISDKCAVDNFSSVAWICLRQESELMRLQTRMAHMQEARAEAEGSAAQRTLLSIRAGQDSMHRIPWTSVTASNGQSCIADQVRWSAVVLEGLDIELEISILLRPPAGIAEDQGSQPQQVELVLQRQSCKFVGGWAGACCDCCC